MSQPTSITCESINDQFARESGRLGLPIYRLGLFKDPFLRNAVQGTFPDHMGTTIRTLISQRTEAQGNGWANVGTSDGDSANSCLPPIKKVEYASDELTFTLQHQALESDFICLEDVRTSTFPAQEVQNYIKMLADNVNVEWIKRYDDDYFNFAEHKVVVAPGLPEDDTDFPSTQPTSQLSLGVLRTAYQELVRDNAGDDGDAVNDDGAPVFHVFCDMTTAENLAKGNEDVRQDVRWSDRVNELLGPNGSFLLPRRSYGGFVFHNRPFPKRFNDDGAGGYTEVAPYIRVAAGNGKLKSVLNPAYKNAKYNSALIFNPKVCEWLVPNPNLKVGGLTYGPQNYRGDFKWINEYDRTCNPDKNSGYWRAKMAVAAKPIYPQWGYYYLFLNCSLANDLSACAAGSGYISA